MKANFLIRLTALFAIRRTKNYVSIVSAWELAIKIGKGKLVFEGGTELFFRTIGEYGFGLLSIKPKHVKIIETLPRLHGDPFDRILIASAMSDGMCLLTDDENIQKYDVPWLW
jgi:PIN domain nuclease of toxin-antitoxin system